MKKSKNRSLAYLALLGNVIIWGAALPIVKPGLEVMSSSQFLMLRYLIAAPLMLPFLIKFRPKKHMLSISTKILTVESFQIIGQLYLLYEGLKYTTALSSGFISNTAPIFITLGGIFLLKEREERREWWGLAISFLGSLLILLPSLSPGAHTGSFYGNGLVFLSTISWVAYILAAKRHFKGLSKPFVTALSCLLGLVFYTIVVSFNASLIDTIRLLEHPSVWQAVLYMGILGSPVAVGLLLYGQQQIEASEAALFAYLQPLIYIPLAVFWLKESLLPVELVGLLLITTGVVFAEKRK